MIPDVTLLWGMLIIKHACHEDVLLLMCRRQVNWREAKGEEEINIYQSERRRRTIHSLPKESRVNYIIILPDITSLIS